MSIKHTCKHIGKHCGPRSDCSFGSTLFGYEASNILVGDKNIHFLLCALSVNKYEFSMYTVRIFMKCTHFCAAPTTY